MDLVVARSSGSILLVLEHVDAPAARELAFLLSLLSTGAKARVPIHDAASIRAGEHVELWAQSGSRDTGVREIGPGKFVWVLSRGSWDNVVGLLEPFTQAGCSGFQDLNDASGPRVLVSTSDTW